MNRQEIFNKVFHHATKQNERSTGPGLNGGCRYRGDGDTSCFIGCLITDDAYSYNLEGNGVHEGVVLNALEKSGIAVVGVEGIDFLQYLQRIHDEYPPEKWVEELEFFAETYNLKVPEITQAV